MHQNPGQHVVICGRYRCCLDKLLVMHRWSRVAIYIPKVIHTHWWQVPLRPETGTSTSRPSKFVSRGQCREFSEVYFHVAAGKGCILSLLPLKWLGLFLLLSLFRLLLLLLLLFLLLLRLPFQLFLLLYDEIWWTIIHHYHPLLCINSCISLV